ncbi:hypothetical protein D9M71_141370 [compost metagenome]
MLWATAGLFIDKVTDATWLRSISPTLLANSTRCPSCSHGMGGPARMPWDSGELARNGTSSVCAGPAGRSTRLVRILPSLLCTVTSTVNAQSMAL